MSASERVQDFEYLHASNTNVSNFVSVKLSANNYHVWKSQILCLLDNNNMGGIVDDTFVRPIYSGVDTVRQYDSLARGWILGSVSEDVLEHVHHLPSAKFVWEKLKCIYDAPTTSQKASQATTKDEQKKIQPMTAKDERKLIYHKKLREATIKRDWDKVKSILKLKGNRKLKEIAKEAISNDGSTLLHLAVAVGGNYFFSHLLWRYKKNDILKERDDGNTALHIAAMVGNKFAAVRLVQKNRKLLGKKNEKDEVPLQKAYEYMHLDVIAYLLKASNYDEDTKSLLSSLDSVHSNVQMGVRLLVNAISAKEYGIASAWVEKLPNFASQTDHVLMALAKTFPTEPEYGYRLLHPSFFLEAVFKTMIVVYGLKVPYVVYFLVLFTLFPILIVCFLIGLLYALGWYIAYMLYVEPIRGIEDKITAWDDAKRVLELVCKEIDKLGTPHSHYDRSVLEAASQNAYQVVHEILSRSPKAIHSKDKSGYDIIQLAIINRSEKIYNLNNDFGEDKNHCRTYIDPYGNNILHLAGKLARSSVLNQRRGAALQLQRELQWREEVKKFVFPTYITQENIFGETPDMVFTREHKNLVKEGEEWMKTTAKSCSITAALITTIVFAAAITVPGGSDQEKGIPLFKKKIAFIIFAVSDAISLFASSTSLLVFLSILTARFAEEDFLFSLPNRLFIGLFSLLLSTTTMMVAFSATLFLVFCDGKPKMLILICGLAFIPIATFVILQSRLMWDLFRSTYLSIFAKEKNGFLRIFNPNYRWLCFGTKKETIPEVEYVKTKGITSKTNN